MGAGGGNLNNSKSPSNAYNNLNKSKNSSKIKNFKISKS
jgi:hypothetical protein